MSGHHDALFKRIFSQPEHAVGELHQLLPPEVSARIDWDTLQLVPGSFVDAAMHEVHSDLLYSVQLSGREVLIYLLLEHKSSSSRHAPLQLLTYICGIWQEYRGQHPDALLPPVIPIVVHHGNTKWRGPTGLLDTIDLDPELRESLAPHLPSFRFLLDDLSSGDPRALFLRSMSALSRLVLYCLERSRKSANLIAELREWMDVVAQVCHEHGTEPLASVIWYATLVQDLPDEEVDRFLVDVGSATETDMKTTFERMRDRFEAEHGDQLRAEGRAEGMAEGRAEGMAEGRAEGLALALKAALRSLIEKRFGTLAEAVTDRVDGARPEQLEQWIDRVLTAPSVDAVFRTD